ncbi:MAG TPA: ATP-binding cassette domain-containing protein, partial [bacterium]|nr:ATP-binding cassette domain-containing protein [bacterium]
MVPGIRHILGGFLFSGDDVYKPVRVLSGGERTRLAVARMLLRPANTLLLDEPTNHLDLDSKDVLLDALEDFGGTLIFVSHDRYFVDKLATKIIEIGHGGASVYPGTYEEFLWSKKHRSAASPPAPVSGSGVRSVNGAVPGVRSAGGARNARKAAKGDLTPAHLTPGPQPPGPKPSYDAKKQQDAEARKSRKEVEARHRRIQELEGRIAKAEQGIKELEAQMAAAGFYENHEASKPIIDRHQALMWEVGDLMNKWEVLQGQTEV